MLFGAELVLRNPTLCPIWGFRYLDYVKGDNLEKYGATRMPLMFTPGHKVSLNDTMWIMRTHFEGAATLFHHFFGPFPANFSVPHHPTRAVGYALLGADADRVLIGAWNPIL